MKKRATLFWAARLISIGNLTVPKNYLATAGRPGCPSDTALTAK